MITAIINARASSERLPQKHLYKIGDKTVFEHIIDKLLRIKVISKIYLATGSKKQNYVYERFLRKKYKGRINFFYFADENNVTERIYKLTKKINTKYSILISGDCPLIDVSFIKRLIYKLLKNPQFDFIEPKHKIIHEGTKLFKTNAWKDVFKYSRNKIFLQHPGYVVKKKPNHFKILKYSPEKYESGKKYRLSVDTLSDVDFFNYLFIKLKRKKKEFNLNNVLKLKKVKILNSHVFQRIPGEEKINIKIITYKSEKFGLGHYKRALALKREFTENLNCSIEFFTNISCLKKISSKIKKKDLLIIDLPIYFLNKIEKKLKKFKKVLIIDNFLKNKKFNYLIPNYIYKKNFAVTGGLNHLILDREINYINSIKKKNKIKIKKLLVIGGAFSVDNEILNFMENNKKDLKIIIGPLVKKSTINQLRKQHYKLIINSKNIYEYIANSAKIYCRFGVSVFEAISLNKKPIVFSKNNEKDQRIISSLRSAGFVNIYRKKIIRSKKEINIDKCYLNIISFIKKKIIN